MRPLASPGTVIGGYRIEERLGGGAMGVVYRAEELQLGRRVALKLLAPDLAEDEGFRERFLRESRLAAAIDHPHIIPIYRSGEEDGLLYLAMRYVDGPDLKALLGAETRLDPERALTILDQVADALDTAHERGLVHRDVKPANILISSRAGNDHCYLTDFGLAKSTGRYSGLTAAGEILGTLNYVAPEQIEGKELDGRADLYSLGCVLFECLTGIAPYPRDSEAAVLWAHLRETPPAASDERPELPKSLDAVVAKALAKAPDERYSTCGGFAADARAALGQEVEVGPTKSAGPRVRRRARWPRPWIAVAAAGLVALAAAAAFLASRDGSADSPDARPAGAVAQQILAPVLASDRALTNRILRLSGTGSSLRGNRPGIRAGAAALFASVRKAQAAAASAALSPGSERARQVLQLALSDHLVHARATERAARDLPTYFDIWAVIATSDRVWRSYQALRRALPEVGRPAAIERAAKRLLDVSAPMETRLEPGVKLGKQGYSVDPVYRSSYVKKVNALELRPLTEGILVLVGDVQDGSTRYAEASRRIQALIARCNRIKLELALTPEPRLSTSGKPKPGPAVQPSPLLREFLDAALLQALAAQSWIIATNSGDPAAGSYHSAYLDAGQRASERANAFFRDFERLQKTT